MNQETNDFLKQNLDDAHAIFNSIIREIKESDISYEYEFIKQEEETYYTSANNLLILMNKEVYEYNNLISDNIEFFNGKNDLYLKYLSLYVISIVFIKVYHEIFNTEKFNEFWHYLVGLFLGSSFIGLLNRDLNEYKGDTKEKRDLVNHIKTLKEEYKENHDKAVISIDYIFSLNDKLWKILDTGKSLEKVIK